MPGRADLQHLRRRRRRRRRRVEDTGIVILFHSLPGFFQAPSEWITGQFPVPVNQSAGCRRVARRAGTGTAPATTYWSPRRAPGSVDLGDEYG